MAGGELPGAVPGPEGGDGTKSREEAAEKNRSQMYRFVFSHCYHAVLTSSGRFIAWIEILPFHYIRQQHTEQRDAVTYRGKIKLHGTNAGVTVQHGGAAVSAQSRNTVRPSVTFINYFVSELTSMLMYVK